MADDFEEPVRRTVSANDVPAVGRSGSPFDVLAGYRAGSDDHDPAEAGVIHPRPKSKDEVERARNAQFKVACVLLAAGGSMERDAIAAQLDGVPHKALCNALANMRTAGRAEKSADGWRLTDHGRAWATGGANLMNQRAAAEAEKPRKARAVATVEPAQLMAARPSFRCWLASDATFAMEKAGQRIELTLEETRQMLRYLDAVGEQLVAAAGGEA